MTNQEAIKRISEFWMYHTATGKRKEPNPQDVEAFSMAIAALAIEQQCLACNIDEEEFKKLLSQGQIQVGIDSDRLDMTAYNTWQPM